MGDGRIRSLAKTYFSLVNNLWWNIVMDDWNLDEIPHVSNNNCNTANLQSPGKFTRIDK